MKRLAVIGLLLFFAFLATAQEVAEEELKSVDREIEFINYTGPYDRIDTAEEIKAIGYVLASSLKEDGRRGRFLLKYSVIRAVDPKERGRFDADILSIDPEAKVDHIDNVRRILSGYLEGAFRYFPADARTLARFATIYNAVYRGDLGYFSGKYKNIVLSHLSRENAGLSTRYDEWPGATRMLIPLGEGAPGQVSALSTTELTEKKVIEEMRRQPDMGLEDRKDMVELKEREVEEKREELEAERESVEREKVEVEEKREELEAAKIPEEKARLEAEVAREERELKEAEAEAAVTEAEIAKKEEEIAEEREGIIKDERSKDEREAAERERLAAGAFKFSDQLYYLKVRSREPSGSISGTLSILDPQLPGVSATSPVSHVRGRAYYFFQDSILVVANESSGSSPARLMLLDPLSLKERRRSTEELHPESFVLIQGGWIYAAVRRGGQYRLGRFDENLALKALSEEGVERDTSVSLFTDRVYLNSPQGIILILNREDLRREGEIR